MINKFAFRVIILYFDIQAGGKTPTLRFIGYVSYPLGFLQPELID